MHGDSTALVSVIVPIYNASKYLEQCLDSILGQTHAELEVICIDDGCTDDSPAIIDAYAARDPRVRPVHKANGGYGQGCNTGIELAQGEWISIIEPDDWIDTSMYERMLDFADGFAETIDVIKASWTDVDHWDRPGHEIYRVCALGGRFPSSTKPFGLGEHPQLIMYHPAIWSAIYRRDFLNEKGIRFVEYPGAGWADNPFLVETLCQAKNIVYLDEPVYFYRHDLKDSTRHHKTDEAIYRPFERWLDMRAVMDRLGVNDVRIVQAHNLRAFNYCFGAMYDDGWENPLVQQGTREVFSKLDPDLVLVNDEIAPHRKKFFFDLMGLPMPRITRWYWAGHLFREGVRTLKLEGPHRVIARIWNSVTKPELAQS